MPLSGNNRAQAIYNVLSTQTGFGKLSQTEKNYLLSQLQAIYGADTTYLTGNAQVNPGTLAVPAGVPVATTGTAAAQTGATTGPGGVGGAGTLS